MINESAESKKVHAFHNYSLLILRKNKLLAICKNEKNREMSRDIEMRPWVETANAATASRK